MRRAVGTALDRLENEYWPQARLTRWAGRLSAGSTRDTQTNEVFRRLRAGLFDAFESGALREFVERTDVLDLVDKGPDYTQALLDQYLEDQLGASSEQDRYLLAFLNEVLWPVASKARGLVVGFNLPFDLSRLAVASGRARGKFYGGGHSLVLWEYEKDGMWRENRYRPRITVKSIDSKRSLIGFTKRRSPDQDDLIPEESADGALDPRYVFPGHFLDLRALAFALTNQSHSLASACAALGVEHAKLAVEEHGVISNKYIAYARRDVLATWELFQKLIAEHGGHPIALPPTKAFSPASVGKAYLAAMGITPPLVRWQDFPKQVLGYAMGAYYWGRAECRIRRSRVPVDYLDFLSMYPTVNALMGLWDTLVAKEVSVEDGTEDVRQLLASVTLEAVFDPAFWRRLPVLVKIRPDSDIVPVRASYDGGQAWQIGCNVLAGGENRWYTLAHCVASTLLSGKPPEVVEAVRLMPHCTQDRLRSVRLRGEVAVDPAHGDFFRQVIKLRKSLPFDLPEEERERLGGFLKVLANAASYGIFAEMNRQDSAKQKTEVEVYGLDAEPFTCRVSGQEEPGRYCFPPLAAFIAGAARLMLALLERSVSDFGGRYAMCDTDSMAIVATETGGLVPCPGGTDKVGRRTAIRALSWAQVEGIRQRFARLNPYDPGRIGGSVLRLEDVNQDADGARRQLWCYAISAKRYCLYTLDERDEPELVKWSEHGLGHLLNPSDPDSEDRAWMRQVWEGIVGEALGRPVEDTTWLDRSALSRLTISSSELLTPFHALNAGTPWPDQVKPFNFLLVGHVRPFGHPVGVDPSRFQPIAPYESDPSRWHSLPWIDRYSGKRYRVGSVSDRDDPEMMHLQTYRDVVREFRTHPEAKSAGADGMTCGRRTVGLLQRRVVQETYVAHVGKEANKLEEVEAGLEHDPEVIYTEYIRPGQIPWRSTVRPVLKLMSARQLTEATGLAMSTIKAARNGHTAPHGRNRQALIRAAAAFSRERLREWHIEPSANDLATCAMLLKCTHRVN